MSYTKRQFITASLEEVGIASYSYDVQPEQLESAMRRLDALIAAWNARGVKINYPIPSSPENSSLDDETGVPDFANQAIILGLAIQLAPSYGKQVAPDTKTSFKESYRAMVTQLTRPVPMSMPSTMPKGAGHKGFNHYNDNPFLQQSDDNTVLSPTNEASFLNE